MSELIFAGQVPTNIKEKAMVLMASEKVHCSSRWKKIRGLHRYFSMRINNNYRVLSTGDSLPIVCNHDVYERKIKTLKRRAC